MELNYFLRQIKSRYWGILFKQFILFCFFMFLVGVTAENEEMNSTIKLIIVIIAVWFAWKNFRGMGHSIVVIFKAKYLEVFRPYDKQETFAKVRYEIDHNIVYKDSRIKISKTFLEYKDFLADDYFVIPLNNILGFFEFENDKTHRTNLEIVDIYGNYHFIEYFTTNKEEIRKSINAIKENSPNGLYDFYPEDYKEMEKNFIEKPEKLSLSDMFNNYKITNPPKKKTPKKEIIEEPVTKEPVEEPLIEEKPIKEEKTKEEKKKVEKKPTKTKSKEKDLNTKYDELKKLKDLLDNDIITKEEFNKEKAKILKD